ncbi:MAG TPA: ferrous iron transport protein A [bacterium]|nr:ferrous iron transport protein A [bacterium]
MKLAELQRGDKAVVTSVDSSGETGMRLIDMGLVAGAHLKFLRKAPLGDPIEIQIRGFLLALRKEEAARISVEVTGHMGDGVPMGKRERKGRMKGRRHEGKA